LLLLSSAFREAVALDFGVGCTIVWVHFGFPHFRAFSFKLCSLCHFFPKLQNFSVRLGAGWTEKNLLLILEKHVDSVVRHLRYPYVNSDWLTQEIIQVKMGRTLKTTYCQKFGKFLNSISPMQQIVPIFQK
jgi:hypothetical protein